MKNRASYICVATQPNCMRYFILTASLLLLIIFFAFRFSLLPPPAHLLHGPTSTVLGATMWLHFLPVPPPPGGPAANCLFAIYGSGYLTLVKVLEVTGGLMLLSGRFTNLALTLVGPVVVNIALYHFFLVKGGYEMPVVLGVLSLVALSGRKVFLSTLFSAK